MCILYKKATKEFVHFDTKTRRSDLITDIKLASELTNAEAKELLKKCTKKLKGFQITQRESFQPKEPAAPAIVIPAQPAATTVVEPVQQAPETPPAVQQAITQPVQSAATQPTAVQPTGIQPATVQQPAQSVHLKIQPVTKTPRRCFTSKERSEIYIRDKGKCGICGKFIPLNEFTIDHIVPISKGGTYDYDNLQCCCFKCNQLKSNEMPDDFYGKMFIALLNHAKQQNNKKMKKFLKKAEKAFFEKPKKKSKKS